MFHVTDVTVLSVDLSYTQGQPDSRFFSRYSSFPPSPKSTHETILSLVLTSEISISNITKDNISSEVYEEKVEIALEFASDPLKSSISKHFSECEHANFILNLNHIFDNLNDLNDSDSNLIQINLNILTLTFCFSLKLYISNKESQC